MKRVLILGCTGSIGKSSIDIVQNMSEDFTVCGLQAHSNKDELLKLSVLHKNGVLTDEEYEALKKKLL